MATNQNPEAEKTYWEIEKLKIETKSLEQPFRRQPTLWFAVATLLLSLGGNLLQYSKADRDKQLAQIEKDKLDLETTQLQGRKSNLENEVKNQRTLLADVNQQLQSSLQRLDSLKAHFNPATPDGKAVLEALAEARQSVQTAQEINETTAASLTSPATDKLTRSVSNWQLARDEEREGFKDLISGQFDDAAKAFQASENAVNGYHYAYELARLIRKRRSDLDDTVKRKDVLRTIITQYSRGAPKDLIDRLGELSK